MVYKTVSTDVLLNLDNSILAIKVLPDFNIFEMKRSDNFIKNPDISEKPA